MRRPCVYREGCYSPTACETAGCCMQSKPDPATVQPPAPPPAGQSAAPEPDFTRRQALVDLLFNEIQAPLNAPDPYKVADAIFAFFATGRQQPLAALSRTEAGKPSPELFAIGDDMLDEIERAGYDERMKQNAIHDAFRKVAALTRTSEATADGGADHAAAQYFAEHVIADYPPWSPQMVNFARCYLALAATSQAAAAPKADSTKEERT